jgi:hypothetical protein
MPPKRAKESDVVAAASNGGKEEADDGSNDDDDDDEEEEGEGENMEEKESESKKMKVEGAPSTDEVLDLSEETFDTATKDGIKEFLDAFDAVSISATPHPGDTILELISRLPAVNGTFSQGTSRNRLLKYMKAKCANLLPPEFPTAGSKVWTQASKCKDNLPALKSAMRSHFKEADRVAVFAKGFLTQFEDEYNRLGGERSDDRKGAVLADRIALFGHLLIDPSAQTLWTEYHTPVEASARVNAFNSAGGINGSKTAILQKLMSIGNRLAEEGPDLSLFTEEHCGEGALECLKLSAKDARFEDVAEFKKNILTPIGTLHDTLIENLTKSGEAYPEGSSERRERAWTHFLGATKNVPLYYCYILWEGKDTKHLSRSLPVHLQKSSTSASASSTEPEATVVTTPGPGGTLVVAPPPTMTGKKELQAWYASQAAIAKVQGRTPGSATSSTSSLSTDQNTALNEEKVQTQKAITLKLGAETKTEDVNRLVAVINSGILEGDMKARAQAKLAELLGL